MREILFRGKRMKDGAWIEGFYCEFANNMSGEQEHFIQTVKSDGRIDTLYYIDPATVGQYTGLTDKNGKRIFEGDVVLFKWDKEHNYCHIIEFVDGEFCATPVISRDDTWQIRICGENEKFSVIGNIHDNPELLEVET